MLRQDSPPPLMASPLEAILLIYLFGLSLRSLLVD